MEILMEGVEVSDHGGGRHGGGWDEYEYMSETYPKTNDPELG